MLVNMWNIYTTAVCEWGVSKGILAIAGCVTSLPTNRRAGLAQSIEYWTGDVGDALNLVQALICANIDR